MNLLVFPHQLYKKHPGLKLDPRRVALIEDSLLFGDAHYPAKFHKQKLWLHRATMKRYAADLEEKGHEVVYCDHDDSADSLEGHLRQLFRSSMLPPKSFATIDPVDFMLRKRLDRFCSRIGIRIEYLPNPGFLNSTQENETYRSGKKRWFMADFYKWQRQRMGILLDEDGKPVGGKWSFDEDNRKKVPKKLLTEIPQISKPKFADVEQQAKQYVEEKYADNPGSLERLYYPTTQPAAASWLKHFLKHRFENFGVYEDAIVQGESWLWHSVLTPMLNVGLLTPDQVVKEALKFADANEVPLNSLEGFVRQVIGWREFIRATYEDHGVEMRTTNHWGHHRQMPSSFYDASTGMLPIDDTIERIVDTGYCHHIER